MTEVNNAGQPYHVQRVDSVESETSDSADGPGLSLKGYSDGTDSRLRGYDETEQGDAVLPLREPPSAGFGPASSGSSNSIQTPSYSTNPSLNSSYGPSSSSATSYSWSSQSHPRMRGSGGATLNPTSTSALSSANSRPQRPTAARTPSSAYAPPRRPSQFGLSVATRHRSSSETRTRLNPEADYRAQKKAYVQRLRQDNTDGDLDMSPDDYTPSVEYSTDSETEEESPANDYSQQDSEDPETIMYYGNEETQPSVEELKIPANRERLEWHSMLANVLTGDVVKQEKKRLTGGTEQMEGKARKAETWMGVKARFLGRTLPAQKRVIEEQRSHIPALIEEIASFEIKGETEVGMDPRQQVERIVKKIEKIESLYPTSRLLKEAHPRVASDDYRESVEAILAWHNTTELINTELGILQAWVGNEELDFLKPREKRSNNDQLVDEASFIERILKEDGLKSLQGNESLIVGVDRVIHKAKETLMMNANAFSNKHLPPYIEELLTLINFPSRLVQEIIRMRLQHMKNIKEKETSQQGVFVAEQMISQFQILLSLAVKIKDAYVVVSKPKPGWDLPPCIDENFDSVVLGALRFYFKMLNWKLSANRNTFKEAEILEQEWEYSNELGRHFQGGDVEVAEQFSSLTSKSLNRLTSYFEKELKRRPDEVAGPEMDRRYKQILDSVRVRQRKLFRFSRLLSQTFENSIEFNLILDQEPLQEFYENLVLSGHILISQTSNEDGKDITCVIASPTLQDSLLDAESILRTAYRVEITERKEPLPYMYVLVIRPESPINWEGQRADIEIPIPELEVKTGKVRLVADGAHALLQRAKDAFFGWIGIELDVIIPQRANLPSVDKELLKVKKQAYKLSNTIMDSVENIRKQLAGLECQELIQTCFAFATEFGQRSVMQMDYNRRAMHKLRLTRLALDWVSFICDDCVASERKTFKWAVVALEFAMVMTTGQNILTINEEEYARLRSKVSGCMSLLISHFDIMGARSTVAAQAEKQRTLEAMGGKLKLDVKKLKDDEESSRMVSQQWMEQLENIDELRKARESESKPLGRVLESSTEADRSLTFLSSSATNVTLRWQQGQYIGGGTFGSVYAATNIDSGQVMAVKEIRLQDPQLIPTIVSEIRDEMSVLQILDHPNIVDYYGIEVHRDKVYIFMEYCAGGSLAGLLEHGRIEDETVITVYALQMVEGLAYLHESGVVHRDIKPENILLDHNGVIKYVDFGAAKIIAKKTGRTVANGEMGHAIQGRAPGQAGHRQGRQQKSMTGTPMYMSPEVIRGTTTSASTSSGSRTGGSPSDPSSPTSPTSASSRPGAPDTWSLGCVILEMATGRRPWASLDNEWAIMYNIAQGNSPALPSKHELSDEGIDFLKRCFERDPSRRATPAELLQHEWLLRLRNQLSLQPTAGSETSKGSGGTGTGSGGNTPGSAGPSGGGGGWMANGGGSSGGSA